MRLVITALATILSVASLASAQVLSVPAPAPTDNASDRDWFMARVPIYVNGDTYYPAGATVFFDRNTMVPSLTFDGVQIYTDTTLEPHSVFFVPIGRALLQPYERRRQGELAGTTGSRTPSFPIQHDAEALATNAPYNPPGYIGDEVPLNVAVDSSLMPQPASSIGVIDGADEAEMPVTGSTGVLLPPVGPVRTAIPPASNAGIWIEWNGARWQLAGRALPHIPGALIEAGDYHGYTVYQPRHGDGSMIYLPSRDDLIVPYRRGGIAPPQP